MLKSFLGYMSQNRWARWSFLLFPLLILPPTCSFLIAARYEICAPESILFLCDEQWIGNYDNIFFSLGQGDGGGFFSFSNLEEVQIISVIMVGLAILVGLISFGIGCWLLRKLMLRKKEIAKIIFTTIFYNVTVFILTFAYAQYFIDYKYDASPGPAYFILILPFSWWIIYSMLSRLNFAEKKQLKVAIQFLGIMFLGVFLTCAIGLLVLSLLQRMSP